MVVACPVCQAVSVASREAYVSLVAPLTARVAWRSRASKVKVIWLAPPPGGLMAVSRLASS